MISSNGKYLKTAGPSNDTYAYTYGYTTTMEGSGDYIGSTEYIIIQVTDPGTSSNTVSVALVWLVLVSIILFCVIFTLLVFVCKLRMKNERLLMNHGKMIGTRSNIDVKYPSNINTSDIEIKYGNEKGSGAINVDTPTSDTTGNNGNYKTNADISPITVSADIDSGTSNARHRNFDKGIHVAVYSHDHDELEHYGMDIKMFAVEGINNDNNGNRNKNVKDDNDSKDGRDSGDDGDGDVDVDGDGDESDSTTTSASEDIEAMFEHEENHNTINYECVEGIQESKNDRDTNTNEAGLYSYPRKNETNRSTKWSETTRTTGTAGTASRLRVKRKTKTNGKGEYDTSIKKHTNTNNYQSQS